MPPAAVDVEPVPAAPDTPAAPVVAGVPRPRRPSCRCPAPAAPVVAGVPAPAAPVVAGVPAPAAPVVAGVPAPAAPVVAGVPAPAAPVVAGVPAPAAPVVAGVPAPAAPVVAGVPAPAAPVVAGVPAPAAPVVAGVPAPAAPVVAGVPAPAAPVVAGVPAPAMPVVGPPVVPAAPPAPSGPWPPGLKSGEMVSPLLHDRMNGAPAQMTATAMWRSFMHTSATATGQACFRTCAHGRVRTGRAPGAPRPARLRAFRAPKGNDLAQQPPRRGRARLHRRARGARAQPAPSTSCRIPKRPAGRVHRACRARGSRRSPSTRSTPRASAATSSRCRPTRGSSSGQMEKPKYEQIRGPVADHRHRAEVGVVEPALDRRDGDRDLRLPAGALRARGRAALPPVRGRGGRPLGGRDRRRAVDPAAEDQARR